MKFAQVFALLSVLTLSAVVHAQGGGEYTPVNEIVCTGSFLNVSVSIRKFSDGTGSYDVDYDRSGATHNSYGRMNGFEIPGVLVATSPIKNNTYSASFSYDVEDTWTRFVNVPVTCVITK
jgi:hypothetical protein